MTDRLPDLQREIMPRQIDLVCALRPMSAEGLAVAQNGGIRIVNRRPVSTAERDLAGVLPNRYRSRGPPGRPRDSTDRPVRDGPTAGAPTVAAAARSSAERRRYPFCQTSQSSSWMCRPRPIVLSMLSPNWRQYRSGIGRSRYGINGSGCRIIALHTSRVGPGRANPPPAQPISPSRLSRWWPCSPGRVPQAGAVRPSAAALLR
jgi:hypothetical protein